MPVFTYEQYLNSIPPETKSFVKRLIAYLYDSDELYIYSNRVYDDDDQLIFKAIKAFEEESEKNRNVLKLLGYDSTNTISFYNIGTDTGSKYFTQNYNAFVPFKDSEEYLLLTPEDIIKNIFDNVLPSNKSYYTYRVINLKIPEFIRRLVEMAEPKKTELLEKYNQEFNKELSISTINYYNMAGKIYIYLRNNKDKLINIEPNASNLKNLAMLIAIFYYDHVSAYKDNYNEQQIIIDYFKSKDLTIEKITQAIGLPIDKEELDKIDPTLVLYNKFINLKPRNTSRDKLTVGSLVHTLINGGYEDSIIIKKVLGSCNLTIHEVKDIEDTLKKYQEEINAVSVDDIYKGLLPNVISYLKRVARIYTYLFNKKDSLEKSLVDNGQDLITLAIVLSSYEFKNDFQEFFSDNGLTLDKVLELVKLPTKEVYQKEVNETEPNEKELTKYERIIISGENYNNPKDTITVESIVRNITNKDYSKSALCKKLFKLTTGKNLEDNFTSQIEKHQKDKREKQKRLLTEETLKNVPISVFNYLKVLCSYYKILSNKGLDQKDLEQISIIMAASRFDKEIEEYLNNLGMSRNSLANALKIEFSYQDKTFDIDIILKYFKPYIFDRKNEDITVYSIFENAFKPELTNTLNLRRVLFKYGLKPEDFQDIRASLAEWQKKKITVAEEEKIRNLFYNSNGVPTSIIEDMLRFYEYLTDRQDKVDILKTKNDLKEAAILLAILSTDNEFNQFFYHNGITLEFVMNTLKIDSKELDSIRSRVINRKLILDFENYLKKLSSNDLKGLIKLLLNDSINDSKVLEKITEISGNNYEYLVEELKNQKERDITPDQGIKILNAEEVTEIEDSSLGTIAEYGLPISRHSRYINNALHDIISSDTLEHSLDNINTLLGEASYEQEVASPKKRGFLSRIFELEPEKPQVVIKYDYEKIGGIESRVDEQITILTKELRGYELIKKYIEAYLRKLNEYLRYLKAYYKTIEVSEVEADLDEIESFTRTLDQNSSREIILDKINSFETMILLMKQELVTVHRSIINHFITINALQTSKSAILPLIATEVAIAIGKKTEEESLTLTGDLISLFQNVVNKNIDGTKLNLERLRLSSISEETYSKMNREINGYLESLNRSNALLAKTEEQPVPEEQHKFTL